MNDEEYREAVIEALHEIAGGKLRGPSGLEGIAIAMAGEALRTPLGPALEAIASALDRIATALEDRK